MQTAVLCPSFVQAPPRIRAAAADSGKRSWIWAAAVFLAIVVPMALLVYGVTSFLRLSRDARALRNCFLQTEAGATGGWHKTVELSIGRLTCLALRTGVGFFPVDPIALTALSAVQGAEVGVYQMPAAAARGGPVSLLSNADAAMAKRGWEPLVKVVNRADTVLIYTPQGQKSGSSIRVCLAVLQHKQLVVVSARANPEALIELAAAAQERNGRFVVPGLKDAPRLNLPGFGSLKPHSGNSAFER